MVEIRYGDYIFLYLFSRFCFVEYESPEAAESALKEHNGQIVEGLELKISFSRDRQRDEEIQESSILLVRNLAQGVTVNDLKAVFEGTKNIKLPSDKYTGKVKT